MRDKLAERTKSAFLILLNVIGTVWSFLFVKTQDPDETDVSNNEIRQDVVKNRLQGEGELSLYAKLQSPCN